MFENFTLADLKNAPLSILVFLSLSGNRAVTVTDLAAETGFSEKPIRKGLKTLRDLGLITEPRKNRYQLTGKEYQLPLSWGERILEAGESPEISGDLPGNTGVSPELERRVMLLEQAVFGNRDAEAGDSPEISGEFPLIESDKEERIEIVESPREEWSGNTPGKLGVFPVDGRNSRKATVTGQWVEKESAGETPEKTGDIPGITGDIPEGINPLINNLNINKVSKYVGSDTYLPDITNTAMSGLTPAGENAECGMRDAELKWNTAMTQIKGSMDRDSYGTMLRDAKVIGYEEGHYTVAVKLQWVRDWVDQRCREIIEGILTNMSGMKCSVSFVVAEANAECGIRNAEHFIGHTGYHSQMKSKEPEIRLLPESLDNRENVLVEICNDYLRDPSGIDYTVDQMAELVEMYPDPRVLRFALPTLSSFEAAKVWCAFPFPVAKEKLLARYGIDGKDLQDNEAVSLEIIYDVCKELKPEEKKYAIKRILLRSKGNIPM